MDYKEKYEQALERTRESYRKSIEQGWTCDKEIYENIFPELRESEDERIRKAQLDYWRSVGGKEWYGVPVQETIAWLEKQGEQKPTDKIEPRFKVGDWVVIQGTVYQITKAENLNVTLSLNGRECLFDIDVLKNAHLWTIQDAKDGDVLEFVDHEKVVVGIVSFVNERTEKVDVSCLLEDNKFKIGNFYALDTINPHPATKEQRDLLFSKMKETGYEWDAEKKELNKIEQKPAWSEEDERTYNEILDFFLGDIGTRCVTIDKQRHFGYWLKSLKPQKHWKPSEEQLVAIKFCCANFEEYDALQSLYNDLKKL